MRWLLIVLLFSSAFGQEICRHCPVGTDLDAQFPEAPSSAKPRFFTKTWLAAETIHGLATGFDIHETLSNEGRCGLEGNNGFPENVGAGDLTGEALAEFGFGIFVHAIAYRAPKSFQWINYLDSGYGTALHLRGGIEWYTRCH